MLKGAEHDHVLSCVRVIPDWPTPGVAFQDLSGVLEDGRAFGAVVRSLRSVSGEFDVVVGIEARGFVYGSALAFDAGTGFVTMRKPGKLPRAVHSRDYDLEYGSASLEIHQDALVRGQRVVIVDDVLATGGTAAAAIDLVRRAGGEPVALSVVMEIPVLGGRAVIESLQVPVRTVFAPDLS